MLPHNVLCSAQRARPQLRACFAPRSVRGLNYGRVLLRAACAASITGVFCSAQRARPQLRACFASRSVRNPITGVFGLKSRVFLLSIGVWGAKNTRIPSLQPFWCGCPESGGRSLLFFLLMEVMEEKEGKEDQGRCAGQRSLSASAVAPPMIRSTLRRPEQT